MIIMKKTNKKGFTLAELLVVVAIIAVLVAIAIPIFTSQLEKAREATDAANIRAAYAEVVSDKITDGDKGTKIAKEVTLTQTQDGWQSDVTFPKNLEGSTTELTKGQKVTITATDSGATIDIKLDK